MEEEIIITEPIEPTRYAQFNSLEAYNAVNVAIAKWKDKTTDGEYSRTETAYEYNPEPEPNWDGFFYMDAKPEMVDAGLFNNVVLLDAIPIETIDTIITNKIKL